MIYTFTKATQNKEVVKLVNKVFHDLDAKRYNTRHPEIYEKESLPWKKTFKDYFVQDLKLETVILDVGTGNGFVIDSISEFLKPSHTVIFLDISEKMIEVVKERFKSRNFNKRFIVSDATQLEMADGSIDIIVLNSALHHIPDYYIFLKEVIRVLKPGGSNIIRHEPNKRFANNFFLKRFYLFLNAWRQSRYTDSSIDINFYDSLFEQLSKIGVDFFERLTPRQIDTLVDIESATASGGLDANKGFDPYSLMNDYFVGFKLISLKTYAFLGKVDEKKNIFTKIIAHILRFIFPKDGYLFELIIKK